MAMKRFPSLQLGLLIPIAALALVSQPVRGMQNPQPPVQKRQTGVETPVVTSGYLILIRDPVVQKHLKLSRNQGREIQQLTDTIDGPLWKLRGLPAPGHAAAVNRLITQTRPSINKVLSPQQSQRLEQIVLRAGWPQCLLLDDVRQELKYSAEQLQRIVDKFQETQQARSKSQNQSNKEPAEADIRARGQALEAEWRMLLEDILDKNQQRKLTALLGEPFDGTGLGNVKFKAPQLDGSDGWINSRPLSMKQLRGQVIVLHYWAYG